MSAINKNFCNFIQDSIEKEKFRELMRHMHDRCYDTENENYHRYGKRGIKIYKKWRFRDLNISNEEKIERAKNFYYYIKNLGWEPCKGLQIDRIDNDKGYYPGNIRVVSQCVNMSNNSQSILITFRGITKTISGWERFAEHLFGNTLKDKFNYDLEAYYNFSKKFQKRFNRAFYNYKTFNIDKDRDFHAPKIKANESVIRSLTYKNRYMPKKHWGILLKIKKFSDVYQMSDTWETLGKKRPDIINKIDNLILNGKVDDYIRNNPDIQSNIKEYHCMKTNSTGWANLLNVSTKHIKCSFKSYGSIGNFLDNSNYKNVFFNLIDNNFNHIINCIKTHFINTFLYDERNKIDINYRFDNKNLISNPKGQQFIKCPISYKINKK